MGSGAGAAGAGAAGDDAAGVAGASFAAPMIATTPPTATVLSVAATISISTPAAGDGISVSTLSVETSSNGSSTATVSPTFFSQRVTVPSVTLSPSAGIVTWIDIPGSFRRERAAACRRARGALHRGLRFGSDVRG